MPKLSTKQQKTPINRQAACSNVVARPFMGAVKSASCADKPANHKKRILAIETSGTTFSLALAEDGCLVSEVFWYSGLTHSERLIPALDRLLSDAGWHLEELSVIAVSTGPGSFTGIRVGLSCARTLAQTLHLPLVGMTTLELLAAAVPEGPYRVVPIIDALRGEVFTLSENGDPVIISVTGFKRLFKKSAIPFLFVGNAVESFREEIKGLFGKKAVLADTCLNSPRAGVLALAAQKLQPHSYTRIHPLYIRRSWAEEKQRNP